MTDPDCVFCKIVAGDIPAEKVFEDEHSLAFLDIGPVAEGHVLLIPKMHAAEVDDLTAGQAAAMLRHVPALVAAVKRATGCAGVNVLQNNGSIAHQQVMHVHFHVIPRDQGDAFAFNWPAGSYTEGVAARISGAIREHLGD